MRTRNCNSQVAFLCSRFVIFLVLITLNFPALSQRQFSVVCNKDQNRLEVIPEGEEKPFHTLIRSNFPNQRAAEGYLNENAASIQCGNRPVSQPPPKTPAPAIPAAGKKGLGSVDQSPERTRVRKGAKYYNRHFRIQAGVSHLFGLDKMYGENVSSSSQSKGYDLGVDLTFGKVLRGGLGIHYVSLYGGFEELLLDVVDDFDVFYGGLNAFKGEVLLQTPGQIGKDSWMIFEFGFGYYFNVDLGIMEEYQDILIPAINDEFFSLRWRLGTDLKGFNAGLDGEIIYKISEEIDKESFFQLKLILGYAF